MNITLKFILTPIFLYLSCLNIEIFAKSLFLQSTFSQSFSGQSPKYYLENDNIENNNMELVPNSSFQIIGDEVKYNELVKKMGLKNVMLELSLEKYKEKIEKINKVDFRKMNAWQLWKDFKPTNLKNENEKTTLDMRSFLTFFDLNKNDFIGSPLSKALEKDVIYDVNFQFYPTKNLQELSKENAPSLGFYFLNEPPNEKNKNQRNQKHKQYKILPDTEINFIPSKDAKSFKKRKKVIDSYKKEYGGKFDSQEWKDFTGEKIPFENITFQYTAKGDETYILLGNHTLKNQQKMPVEVILKKMSIKKSKKYNTKTN